MVRRPDRPAVVFTPGLSEQGRADYTDLIQHVAQAQLHRTTGIGYAGPKRFQDLVDGAAEAEPPLGRASASASSIFTSASSLFSH